MVEEVISVIKCLKRDQPLDLKAVPYFKAFAGTLAPHMTKKCNAKTQDSPLGTQLNTTYIMTIPKPDKKPVEVSNYRPIPLINSEMSS